MILAHKIMNHRHSPAGLQAGIYIKKNYVLGWCKLPILPRWAMDRYATIVRLFDSYWYTNLSLTLIIMVNILLRALLTGSEYVHKFITQLPKDYYLIPGKLHHETC